MVAVLRFLFVIPFSFVAACFAASFALLWPFLDKSELAARDPFFILQTAIGFFIQAGQVGSAIVVPFILFVLVTEALGWRSILLHIAAGLAVGFCIIRIAYRPMMPHDSVQTAIMVAATGFMLVYWIFAGRSAGLWRAKRVVSVPSPAAVGGETGT